MANPQKENGFTAIANELLEALACRSWPGESRSVLDIIMRNIYGYSGRKKVGMSISFISQATGLERGNVNRAIKFLLINNIICRVSGDPTSASSYSIQKDYEKWLIKSRVGSFKHLGSDPHMGVGSVPCVEVGALQTLNKTKSKKQITCACAPNINNNRNAVNPVDNSPSLQTQLSELLKTLHPKKDSQIIKNILLRMNFTEAEIDKAIGKDF